MSNNTNQQQNATADEMTTERRLLLHEMADFTALYETVEDKLISREAALEEKIIANEVLLAEQLAKIQEVFAEFQAIMTEAGAARWRLAAENAQREGAAHLQSLQEVSNSIVQTVKEGCEQLGQTTTQTIAGITQATQSLPIEGFKQTVSQGCDRINTTATSAIEKISELIRYFHWKNLAIVFAVTLFVIFLTGLYDNDEWPWEIHAQAVKERVAGKVLIAAWPHLNFADQQDIVNASKKNPGL